MDYTMYAALALAIFAIAWFFYKLDRQPGAFALSDLLVDDQTGKTSAIRFVLLMSFAFTSWLMADLELHGKMDMGYFTAYISAWVAPIVTKIVKEGYVAGQQANTPPKAG